MHPGEPFVPPAWRAAFEAMEDASPTLVAGTAFWIRTTHVVYRKRFLRRELRRELVTEEPAERAYYLLTFAGLHVAQARPKSISPQEPDYRGEEDGESFDFFVPRDRIGTLARWEVGSGGVMAKIAVDSEGACIDIHFEDGVRQFSGGTVDEISAALQRENLIRAVVDGVAPVIESATKICPDCAERIKYLAHVCRYCGYRFDGAGSARGSMLRALYARLSERIADARTPALPYALNGNGHAPRELPRAEVE